MGIDRSWSGVESTVIDPPQLLSGIGIVRRRGNRSGTDQLRAALVNNHARRAIRLLGIPVVRAIVDFAIRLPHRLAGPFVQRHDVLQIESVEVNDQQVSMKNRRRAGATVVVAR